MKKFNIAIVGLGYWGPNILRALSKIKKVHKILVVDKDKKRLMLAKKINKNVFISQNIKEIKKSYLDGIILSTPAKTHYTLGKIALKAKKHLLIEKPIVTKKKDLVKLNTLANKNKLILMSGDLYMYHPAIKKLKKIIQQKNFGKLRYIYSERLNLGRIRKDINIIENLATHDFGIIFYLLNSVKKIKFNVIKTSFLQKKIDDIAFITLKLNRDITANLNLSWYHPEKVRKLSIIGSDKMVTFDDIKKQIEIHNKKATLVNSKNIYDQKIPNFKYLNKPSKIIKFNEEPLKLELISFLNCISKRNKPITGFKFNYQIIDLLEKINQK